MENIKKTITVNLGHIGHKADKLQALFTGYTAEPNEYGRFLKFENFTMIGNKGTLAYTNVVDTEEELLEMIHTRLLFNL